MKWNDFSVILLLSDNAKLLIKSATLKSLKVYILSQAIICLLTFRLSYVAESIIPLNILRFVPLSTAVTVMSQLDTSIDKLNISTSNFVAIIEPNIKSVVHNCSSKDIDALLIPIVDVLSTMSVVVPFVSVIVNCLLNSILVFHKIELHRIVNNIIAYN